MTGSYLGFTIADDRAALMKTYHKICSDHEEMKQYSVEEYCRAVTLHFSRSFSTKINGKNQSALVPMADMLNHHPDMNCIYEYRDDREGFVMEATKDIKHGEPIYDSYGRNKKMHQMLNQYGFVDPTFDDIMFAVEIKLQDCDPMVAKKVELIFPHPPYKRFNISKSFADEDAM